MWRRQPLSVLLLRVRWLKKFQEIELTAGNMNKYNQASIFSK